MIRLRFHMLLWASGRGRPGADLGDESGRLRSHWSYKKWCEASLIYWLYRIEELQGTSCSSVLVEADSRNRPQKMKYKLFMSSTLHSHSHYRKARFDSRPYSFCKNSKDNEIHGAADLDDRPKFFLPSLFSIYSVNLTDDGKLGYGFT
jgi:hypothetical protein